MKGSQLKFLADIADLARLDFEAAAVTIVKDGDRVVSRYKGAYSSGQRWLEMPEAPNLNIAVSAMQFKSIVGLFSDEEEVEVTIHNRSVNLRSVMKEVDLNTRVDMEDLEPFEPEEGTPYLEGMVQDVLREVEVATEFSARSMAKPVLTGLRVTGSNGALDIESSDGTSSLFVTKVTVEGQHNWEMIVPGYDLVLGLKLLGNTPVKLITTQKEIGDPIGQLILYGTNGMFKCSLINGKWPDFTKVKADYPRQKVRIPTSLIRDLVASVRILSSSNDLRLRGDGTHLFLETFEGEYGSFQAKVVGAVNGTFTYDVSSFLLAQNLGSELEVQLPDPSYEAGPVPTYIEAGGRKFWLASKVV